MVSKRDSSSMTSSSVESISNTTLNTHEYTTTNPHYFSPPQHSPFIMHPIPINNYYSNHGVPYNYPHMIMLVPQGYTPEYPTLPSLPYHTYYDPSNYSDLCGSSLHPTTFVPILPYYSPTDINYSLKTNDEINSRNCLPCNLSPHLAPTYLKYHSSHNYKNYHPPPPSHPPPNSKNHSTHTSAKNTRSSSKYINREIPKPALPDSPYFTSDALETLSTSSSLNKPLNNTSEDTSINTRYFVKRDTNLYSDQYDLTNSDTYSVSLEQNRFGVKDYKINYLNTKPSLKGDNSLPLQFTNGLSFGTNFHSKGTCNPCRYEWTKGCHLGFDCRFCHHESHAPEGCCRVTPSLDSLGKTWKIRDNLLSNPSVLSRRWRASMQITKSIINPKT